jgi:hypothetical protein
MISAGRSLITGASSIFFETAYRGQWYYRSEGDFKGNGILWGMKALLVQAEPGRADRLDLGLMQEYVFMDPFLFPEHLECARGDYDWRTYGIPLRRRASADNW